MIDNLNSNFLIGISAHLSVTFKNEKWRQLWALWCLFLIHALISECSEALVYKVMVAKVKGDTLHTLSSLCLGLSLSPAVLFSPYDERIAHDYLLASFLFMPVVLWVNSRNYSDISSLCGGYSELQFAPKTLFSCKCQCFCISHFMFNDVKR